MFEPGELIVTKRYTTFMSTNNELIGVERNTLCLFIACIDTGLYVFNTSTGLFIVYIIYRGMLLTLMMSHEQIFGWLTKCDDEELPYYRL